MGRTFGIISFIAGLIAFSAGWALTWLLSPWGKYFPYVLSILAIVFGILGIVKEESKGLAIAGLVLGTIALILAIVLALFVEGVIAGFIDAIT